MAGVSPETPHRSLSSALPPGLHLQLAEAAYAEFGNFGPTGKFVKKFIRLLRGGDAEAGAVWELYVERAFYEAAKHLEIRRIRRGQRRGIRNGGDDVDDHPCSD